MKPNHYNANLYGLVGRHLHNDGAVNVGMKVLSARVPVKLKNLNLVTVKLDQQPLFVVQRL
jgi:hypothetical protein